MDLILKMLPWASTQFVQLISSTLFITFQRVNEAMPKLRVARDVTQDCNCPPGMSTNLLVHESTSLQDET